MFTVLADLCLYPYILRGCVRVTYGMFIKNTKGAKKPMNLVKKLRKKQKKLQRIRNEYVWKFKQTDVIRQHIAYYEGRINQIDEILKLL